MAGGFSLSSDDWLIVEKGFNPKKQGYYESLFALGNGYLTVRGSLEENPPGSYRGTYMAGIFDKAEGYVRELVKAPGWNDFSIWFQNHRFSPVESKVLSHERILDMRKGILHRTTRLKDPQGRIIRFESKRVVFAHQVRGAVVDVVITPENFSGNLRIYSGINGDVTNLGYFPRERVKHLNLVAMRRSQGQIYLEMETRDDKTKIAVAADTVLENPPEGTYKVNRIYGEKVAQVISFNAEKGQSYHFTKWVSTFTSREGYDRQLEAATTDLLRDMIYSGLTENLKKHLEEREKEWEQAEITIKGDRKAQKGLRFNLYNLIIAKPHHDPTVSIGAKFLTGEGYKGHAFWDTEFFILPFYIHVFPEEAKNLLMYRYYTLKGALQNAKDMGYKGAKYAWESADTGLETTPSYGLREDGSMVKIFTAEEEVHIVADVVAGIYAYVNVTGDYDFLYDQGAEIVFQAARFWLSRVEKRRDRYEIRKVIGPDEFHEHVDNNAFTNYMAMLNLEYALEIYYKMKKERPGQLKALVKKLKLKKQELEKLKTVSKTIYFPYDQKTELVEQFEGYFSLDNIKISKTDRSGMPLFPRGISGDNVEKTQLIKQADVVLLLYIFADRFSKKLKETNYEYYEARTMHESSLSPCAYALMGLEIGDHKKAYNYFLKTSYMDLIDANKNAADGIHAAATGGAWQTVVHGFGGMRVRRGELCFDPWLPKKWQELAFNFIWKGCRCKVKILHGSMVIQLEGGKGKTAQIHVQGKIIKLKANCPTRIKLRRKY